MKRTRSAVFYSCTVWSPLRLNCCPINCSSLGCAVCLSGKSDVWGSRAWGDAVGWGWSITCSMGTERALPWPRCPSGRSERRCSSGSFPRSTLGPPRPSPLPAVAERRRLGTGEGDRRGLSSSRSHVAPEAPCCPGWGLPGGVGGGLVAASPGSEQGLMAPFYPRPSLSPTTASCTATCTTTATSKVSCTSPSCPPGCGTPGRAPAKLSQRPEDSQPAELRVSTGTHRMPLC